MSPFDYSIENELFEVSNFLLTFQSTIQPSSEILFKYIENASIDQIKKYIDLTKSTLELSEVERRKLLKSIINQNDTLRLEFVLGSCIHLNKSKEVKLLIIDSLKNKNIEAAEYLLRKYSNETKNLCFDQRHLISLNLKKTTIVNFIRENELTTNEMLEESIQKFITLDKEKRIQREVKRRKITEQILEKRSKESKQRTEKKVKTSRKRNVSIEENIEDNWDIDYVDAEEENSNKKKSIKSRLFKREKKRA